jgi:hypothetical protein
VTRKQVNWLLALFFLIHWGAVLFRIDRFPLSWAPMYSSYSREPEMKVRVADEEKFMRGFFVTRRDGTTDWIGAELLNVPKWNMYRLYTQRAFKDDSNKYTNGNSAIDPLNRWIRGLAEGEPAFTIEWDWRMFWSLNKSLGLDPNDPEFIVRIQADFTRVYYDMRELRLARTVTEETDLRWKDEWAERWR